MDEPSVLQWLPPSQVQGARLDPSAARGAEAMLMASWVNEFGGSRSTKNKFGSGVLYIEMQLRNVLAATASAQGKPDAFRTACVCECLGKLPEVAGGFSGVLHLLRQELLRAVYLDYEQLSRGGRPVDAQALLARPTFFVECESLRRENANLTERLSDWSRAKLEFAQDADGRNELLRLALARWNAVLSTVKSGTDDVREVGRKLSGLLDSMHQHSKAIDELARLTLLDPDARLHAKIGDLGNGTRRRLLLELIKTHGSSLLAEQPSDNERIELLHHMLIGLSLNQRQQLLRTLIAHGGVVGTVPGMVSSILDDLRNDASDMILRQQLIKKASRRQYRTDADAARVLRADVAAALVAAARGGQTAEAAVQASGDDDPLTVGRPTRQEAAAQTEAQTSLHDLGRRADFLAETAAAVGAEATAALPEALSTLGNLGNSPPRRSRPSDDWPNMPSGDTEAEALLPLLQALEKRCAALSAENGELRAGIKPK